MADLDELRAGMLDIALKFGEGVGRQGEPYAWMLDCRELLLQGDYLHQTCRALWDRLKLYEPDYVGGLTLAANPLTVGILYESRQDGYPLDALIIRRTPKENGLRRQVEGPQPKPGSRVVLVDDLVNSGDTQRQAISALRPYDCEILAVGVMVDYERSGAVWLRERGIAVESLFTLAGLGVAQREPENKLKLSWTFEGLNAGEYSAPKSAPVVADESVFVGSDRGFLLCLDRQGQERWRYAVRDEHRGIHATPLVHRGRVYAGAYDGYLYCVEASSGELVWETRPGQWIGSSAAVHAELDRLFVGIEFGQSGGSLLALDASSGQRCWEVTAGDYIHSSPWVEGDTVYVGSNDSVLRAVEADSGRLAWQFETEGAIKAQPVVADEVCYFGSFDGHLYAVEARTGRQLWKRRLSHHLYNRPLVAEGLVIAGGHSERVIALERQTGKVAWVAATAGALVGGFTYDPTHRAVIVGSRDRRVYLFSIDDGRLLAGYETGFKLLGQPTLAGSQLLVASFGDLYSFSISAIDSMTL